MHIQKFVTLMKGKYEPETVNKLINILTNIFNYAMDPLKCITTSLVSGVERCKVPRKSKSTWSDADITFFIPG